MVLSSGYSTYKRRDTQAREVDVISMMLKVDEKRPNKRARTSTSDDKETVNSKNAAMIRDSNERLPLHLGASIGLQWECGLKTVFEAYPAAVKCVDPTKGLHAFMLAAVADKCDVSTVFDLLLE